MNVAVYSITRDRLDYTTQAFASLREKAGYEYRHYVMDNGSEDGTPNWLRDTYKPHWLKCLPENRGISIGSNLCLRAIYADGPVDLIVKMDNDCEIVTDGIIARFVEIYQDIGLDKRIALSPRVTGINKQPTRLRTAMLAGHFVGYASIIGGLFHVLPAKLYREWTYPEGLPRGRGQDDQLCLWINRAGKGAVGYVEDLEVEHIDGTNGQAAKYPEYFKRKWEIDERESPEPVESLIRT